MSVDTRIPSSSGQVLSLAEGNVLTVGVFVAFSETEIDDENVILVSVISTYQEVVRLDVSVNYAFFMYLLNSLNLFQI